MEIIVKWDNEQAVYEYTLYVDGIPYYGDRKWAERQAKHHDLKVPEEPGK